MAVGVIHPRFPRAALDQSEKELHSQLMLKHSLNPQNQEFFHRYPAAFGPVGFLGSPSNQPPAYVRRDSTYHGERRSAGEAASPLMWEPGDPQVHSGRRELEFRALFS